MTDKMEKPANDYDKGTLVDAVAIMINCHDKVPQINKLDKPTLWRIYDDMKDRGNRFANIEDEVAKLQREVNALHSEKNYLENKVKILEKALYGKRKPRNNNRSTKAHK